MMKAVADGLDGRDLLLFVVDANHEPAEEDRKALEWLKRSDTKAIAVLNKIDLLANKALLLPLIAAYQAMHDFELLIPVSATAGEGIEDLRKAIVETAACRAPAYFPADYLTDQPERFLLAENRTRKDPARHPAGSAALGGGGPSTSGSRRRDSTRSRRPSMSNAPGRKPIVMGTGASRLKEIGTAARLEAEGPVRQEKSSSNCS